MVSKGTAEEMKESNGGRTYKAHATMAGLNNELFRTYSRNKKYRPTPANCAVPFLHHWPQN